MNILLWVIQGVVAIYCVMGSVWRFLNYEQTAKDLPSLGALPRGVWNALGVFEIVCAIGLILPGVLNVRPSLTIIAAACLALEMLLVSGLHVKYFGFQLRATNPATWTVMLCILAVFVAYGRMMLRPL